MTDFDDPTPSTSITLWSADGRAGRCEHVTYRESLDAVYEGPYTLGAKIPWDGLRSNHPGLVGHDPDRGFDLTMPAGQAKDGGYTARDIASAPHGVDYGREYELWATGEPVPLNLVVPGRTAAWQGVRMAHLALGDSVTGTSGLCVQDWSGLDFETMERVGNVAESRYMGGGFSCLPRRSGFVEMLHQMGAPARANPFGEQLDGVAPLVTLFTKVGGGVAGQLCWIDPSRPHDFSIHWTEDGSTLEYRIDDTLVLTTTEGDDSLVPGLPPMAFNRSAFHVDAWQDNGTGEMDVTGVAGQADADQVFTLEGISVLGVP